MSDVDDLRVRLIAEREAACTSAEVCAAQARIEHYNRQYANGCRDMATLTCPDTRIPTPADLAEWLPQCPAPVRMEAIERLTNLYNQRLAFWAKNISWIDDEPLIAEVRKSRTADEGLSGLAHHLGQFRGFENDRDVRTIADVHATWGALPAAERPRHPLALLVDAWQRMAPVAVDAEKRADRRIMPTVRVIGPAPERERGMNFGGLIEDRPRTAELSLFPELEPTRYRVPLLEIVERTVPIRSQGKGAPIEARLLVRGGLLMIRSEDRGRPVVRIAVTVRELLDGLWPPYHDKRGKLVRRDDKNWPRLLDALYRARDWHVPDAEGGRWFPMALRRLPPGADSMPAREALVVIDLAPVPGAMSGPSVDLPWLDRMGVKSGPRWFAYIAGRSLIWLPGTTRRPVPKTGGKVYGWSRNPDDFPVLTLADLRRFGFGERDAAKNRTLSEILAPWQALPDLTLTEATDERSGLHGWRLMPTDRWRPLSDG